MTALAAAAALALAGVPGDSMATQLREEDFLRACSDLGLATALDDLERLEPTAAGTDAAAGILRRIAMARLAVRAPGRTMDERSASLADLRQLRAELVTVSVQDPRVPLWHADSAEDELLLGFLGTELGPQAIAGSGAPEVASRSAASLDRALASLDEAAASDTPGAAATDAELERRLGEDRTVRRPLLRAVALSLKSAIDRTATNNAQREERGASARSLLAQIQGLRPRAPARLRVEADLGEAAAAALAPDSESARFAAARVALAGDAVAFALARILSVDALVAERRVQEALTQLEPIVSAQGMPPSLALLCADAAVRTRIALGKAVATEATLSPWIMVLRRADPPQRAWVRDAVLDRIASALGGAHIEASLPAIAAIAHARERAAMGRSESQAWALLDAAAGDARDREAQACALSSLAWAAARIGDAGTAATALARLARLLEDEPAGAVAMTRAVALELALDDEAPDARVEQRTAALDLARTRYPDLADRDLVAVAQEAARAREVLDRLLGEAPPAPDAAQAAAIATMATRLREGIARCGVRRPGVARAQAALASCDAAEGILASVPAKLALEDPGAVPWGEFTEADTQRLARLRLERAARLADDDAERAAECRSIPAFASDALRDFMEARIARAGTLAADSARERLLGAIAMANAWEAAHDAATMRDLRRLRCRAALLAQEWTQALEESRLLVLSPDAPAADRALRCAALRGAIAGKACGPEQARAVQELMECGKRLGEEAARGSPDWWLAQAAQLEAATLAGRGGEPVRARIARLRTVDSELGGPAFEPAITALDRPAP